ncbi:unnamed protein product [Rhodiola kirilowii]
MPVGSLRRLSARAQLLECLLELHFHHLQLHLDLLIQQKY